MKIGILGGGLTGLTIAANLRNNDFFVLEKEKECGGLCRSFQEKGFTFDYGGAHIIYSKSQQYMQYVLSLLDSNVIRGRRNNKVLYNGTYVKYPFENGLHELPSKEEIFECLYYYLNNNYMEPKNFKEWIYHTFGKGIAEKYLVPYNQKIWNYPLEKMSLHWVDGRVPKPPVEDVIKSAIGIETEGYTHQLYFYYPAEGGIQALIKDLENQIRKEAILRDFQVKQIYKKADKWIVSDGIKEKVCDKLVSTIPIFDLANSLEDIPSNVTNAINGLRYNSLISVMIALETNELPPFTAVYVPDPDFKPNRIAFPHIFSPANAPEGKSSVVAEITANIGDETWRLTDTELSNHVVKGLEERGVLRASQIIFTRVERSKYAYVVYDLDYMKNIKIVRDYFQSLDIKLCGRFAEFEYLNMDACIEGGIAVADTLISRSRYCRDTE